MPVLRERKRYLAFEILSEKGIESIGAVAKAVWKNTLSYIGELGCSEAGIMILEDKYNKKRQRGLIRVNHKSMDRLRATLTMIDQIDGQKVLVRSVGASGILKKAENRYIAG